MQSLCITGLVTDHLSTVSDIAQQIGITVEIPPDQTSLVVDNIHTWQQQVLSHQTGNNITGQIKEVGKLWERLASDIFIQKINQSVWAWADRRSISLLEYWTEFEPGIQFLLISCSPSRYIQSFLDQKITDFDVESLIQDWRVAHQTLLRFALRHPSRCVLLDIDHIEQQPQAFASLCATRFATAKNHYRSLPTIKNNPLTRVLAEKIWQDHLDATAADLWEEVKISYLALLNEKTISRQNAFSDLVAELQKIEQQEAELASAKEKLLALERRYQSEYQEQQEENELLLLQLHQVQEELEHYFLQYQAAEANSIQFSSRWQRLLARQPNYVDYASHTLSIAADSAQPTLICRFNELTLGGCYFEQLSVNLVLEEKLVGLVFDESAQDQFVRWPFASEQTLTILPAPCSDPQQATQRLLTLQQLSTSDWQWINALVKLMPELIVNDTTLSSSWQDAFVSGVDLLQQILLAFPKITRFDQIKIKNQQVSHEYEHIWFEIDNLLYQSQRYPSFEFRLATANVPLGRFGTHPRLEFPASEGVTPIKNWFAESQDHFGDKLELRFALPSDIDMAVWQGLAEDRGFIVALLQLLQTQLAISELGTLENPNRTWQDWQALMNDCLAIMQTYLEQ